MYMKIKEFIEQYKNLNNDELKNIAYNSYKNLAEYILDQDRQIEEWAELVGSCLIVGSHPYLDEKRDVLLDFYNHEEVNPEVREIGSKTFEFLASKADANMVENYYYYIEQFGLGLKDFNPEFIEDIIKLVLVSGIVNKYSPYMEKQLMRYENNVLNKFEY